jgi:hypothetical protein
MREKGIRAEKVAPAVRTNYLDKEPVQTNKKMHGGLKGKESKARKLTIDNKEPKSFSYPNHEKEEKAYAKKLRKEKEHYKGI